MKLIALGLALVTGSGVAMTNETVQEEAKEFHNRVREYVQRRTKGHMVEEVKENGFPYPTEQMLENLTEEQATALIGFIDQVNATYDFANMTDEEIEDALVIIHDELKALHEELEIEMPARGMRRRARRHFVERVLEEGFPYPSEERLANLTDEQTDALIAKIDEINATYDFANMTDEELRVALSEIREELKALAEELDFPVPEHRGPRHHEESEPEETDEA